MQPLWTRYLSQGKTLGTLATERGLSKAEQAAYKSSLGDLCAKLMTASRTSLNTTTSTNAAEERGLSKAEQATYKSSLGNLATLMRASRDSLNANNNNNQSVRNSSKFQQQPQTQPPSAPEADQSSSFQVLNFLQTTVPCKMYLTPFVKYYINRVSLSQDYIP